MTSRIDPLRKFELYMSGKYGNTVRYNRFFLDTNEKVVPRIIKVSALSMALGIEKDALHEILRNCGLHPVASAYNSGEYETFSSA
jgi:hypothetical protein